MNVDHDREVVKMTPEQELNDSRDEFCDFPFTGKTIKKAMPVRPIALIDQPDTPVILNDLFRELEDWAQANMRDERRDAQAFWVLRIPAIAAAASCGLFTYLNWPMVSIVSSTAATFCILVDGVYPRGTLRNVHRRASHDIRNLANKAMNQWRTRNPKSNSINVAKKIIAYVEDERSRIADYIRDAETTLNSTAQS